MLTKLLRFIAKQWLRISLFVLAVISVLSLIPLPELPELAGSDKTHHLLAYALLMFPVALRKPKFWLTWMAFFLAWGGAIELVQPYVNRYAEWADFFANGLGLVIGVILAWLLNSYTIKE